MSNRADVYLHFDSAPSSAPRKPQSGRSGPSAWDLADRISAVEQHLSWVLEDLDRSIERLDFVYKAAQKAGLLPAGGCPRAKPRGTKQLRVGAVKRRRRPALKVSEETA